MAYYYVYSLEYNDENLVFDATLEKEFRLSKGGTGRFEPDKIELNIYESENKRQLFYTKTQIKTGAEVDGYTTFKLDSNLLRNEKEYYCEVVTYYLEDNQYKIYSVRNCNIYATGLLNEIEVLNPINILTDYKYTFVLRARSFKYLMLEVVINNQSVTLTDSSFYRIMISNEDSNFVTKHGDEYEIEVPMGEFYSSIYGFILKGKKIFYSDSTDKSNMIELNEFNCTYQPTEIDEDSIHIKAEKDCKLGGVIIKSNNLSYISGHLELPYFGGGFYIGEIEGVGFTKDGVNLDSDTPYPLYGIGWSFFDYYKYTNKFSVNNISMDVYFKINRAQYNGCNDYYNPFTNFSINDGMISFALNCLKIGENKYCSSLVIKPYESWDYLAEIYSNEITDVTTDSLCVLSLRLIEDDIKLNLRVIDYGDPNAKPIPPMCLYTLGTPNADGIESYIRQEYKEMINSENNLISHVAVNTNYFTYLLFNKTKDLPTTNEKVGWEDENTVFKCDFNCNTQAGNCAKIIKTPIVNYTTYYSGGAIYRIELYKTINDSKVLVNELNGYPIRDYDETTYVIQNVQFVDYSVKYGETEKYEIVFKDINNNILLLKEIDQEIDFSSKCVVITNENSEKGYFLNARVYYGDTNINKPKLFYKTCDNKTVLLSNSDINYKTGSISAMIINEDYLTNGISRVKSNDLAKEIELFLRENKAKILKDWNGNYYKVIFSNISINYDVNYGNGIPTLTANWTEVE